MTSPRPVNDTSTIRVGALSLIGGAVAFMAVFAFLAARFDYPDILDGPAAQQWMAYLGIVTAVAGLVGMFRNVTTAVGPVTEVNNYLLPVWMIVLGVGLLRAPRTR